MQINPRAVLFFQQILHPVKILLQARKRFPWQALFQFDPFVQSMNQEVHAHSSMAARSPGEILITSLKNSNIEGKNWN